VTAKDSERRLWIQLSLNCYLHIRPRYVIFDIEHQEQDAHLDLDEYLLNNRECDTLYHDDLALLLLAGSVMTSPGCTRGSSLNGQYRSACKVSALDEWSCFAMLLRE